MTLEGDILEHLRLALKKPGDGSSDFDLHPDVNLPEGRKLRPAGVLIAILTISGAPQVLLTKRASGLKHHPGQIAFPGGKQDPVDVDQVDAALREANEEVGLPRDLAQVIGTMPPHETVTGFQVTPVIAIIRGPFVLRPEAGEVEEAFFVPLSHLTASENYIIESRRWRGTRRHYFAVPWGPYYIWGATARMLRALAARLET